MVKFGYNGSLEIEQPIDLVTTLESGQTFLWEREAQDIFEDTHSENPTYTTTRLRESGEVMCIRVSENDDGLFWESTHPDAPDYLTEIFRLDQDYQQIREVISENDPKGVIEQATAAYPGLRVINEPLFPTLISFICSPTAKVPRIHGYVQKLCTKYGSSEVIEGREYATFPTVDQLRSATEAELDELNFGIRKNRIPKTVEAIQARSPPLTPLPSELDEARAHLQEYYGVGSKVANCVLLYSGSFDSPVPVDTWIEQAVEKYYPEFAELKGEEAGQRLEDVYGEYAGHAQLYLFHYMRDAEN